MMLIKLNLLNLFISCTNLYNIHDIYFVDINNGCTVGYGGLIRRTTDGGYHWLEIYPETGTLNSVCFSDSKTGFAVGDDGAIVKTTDGGLNWLTLSSGTSVDLESVFFIDNNNGYAVGYEYYIPYSNVILKTTDGGITWEKKEGADLNLYSVYFTNINTGYIAGGNGKILKTTDAGNTWFLINSGIPHELKSIYFLDSLKGYISGNGGAIIKTIDGGISWNKLNSGTNNCNLNKIIFANDSIGYVSGAGGENGRGVLLKTINGGGIGMPLPTEVQNIISQRNIKIYPIPANNFLTIDLQKTTNLQNIYIYIYNIQGQLLMQQPIMGIKTEININRLVKGIYIVKIYSNNITLVSKIVKE